MLLHLSTLWLIFRDAGKQFAFKVHENCLTTTHSGRRNNCGSLKTVLMVGGLLDCWILCHVPYRVSPAVSMFDTAILNLKGRGELNPLLNSSLTAARLKLHIKLHDMIHAFTFFFNPRQMASEQKSEQEKRACLTLSAHYFQLKIIFSNPLFQPYMYYNATKGWRLKV